MKLANVVALLVACGKPAPDSPPPSQQGSAQGSAAATGACERLPFAESTPVPEASGAAWLVVDGKPVLAVISDSGNHGAYGLVDPDTGATLEQGTLPMGAHSDDFEGFATRGDTQFALLSGGWLLRYHRDGNSFRADRAPEPLGTVIAPSDLPKLTLSHNAPPNGTGMVCGNAKRDNCGRNFEGLCLDDTAGAPHGPCAGFAAAKSDGKLFCLVESDGHFTADFARSITVTRPGALADCAFDDRGRLWAGNNFFDRNEVYRIDNWQDPPHAHVVEVGALGVGFPEVIAARGDLIYRMSDTGGSPSLMTKFRCPASTR